MDAHIIELGELNFGAIVFVCWIGVSILPDRKGKNTCREYPEHWPACIGNCINNSAGKAKKPTPHDFP